MKTQITYTTAEQAEQIKKSVIAYFDYEIEIAKQYKKPVNLSLIEAMIASRTKTFKNK